MRIRSNENDDMWHRQLAQSRDFTKSKPIGVLETCLEILVTQLRTPQKKNDFINWRVYQSILIRLQ